MTVNQVVSLFNADITKDFYFNVNGKTYLLDFIQGWYYSELRNCIYLADSDRIELENIHGELIITDYKVLMTLKEYMEKEVTHINIVDSEYIEIYAE